ncbi:MAG: uL15 family ribosomal protein [Candidatus Diapherotrites archaeon]|uniref:50S ribosomal protein L15 n=1 Tax=Candidatus Iainarchaeum sp. TaxID=3101447 RepID=A0A8T4L970_9ARCH|nr:uL15 family ribosomal protein [Candidatus Diapherotrites archaeon]
MVVRKGKKSVKKLGNRTRHGNKKNWRGKGSRGGKGHAGSQKQKRNSYQHLFGKKIRMARKSIKPIAVNLRELDALIPMWIEQKLVEKNKDGQFVIDGKKVGIQKVLGGGDTELDVVFVNIKLTKKASDKVEGTEFESLGGEESQ